MSRYTAEDMQTFERDYALVDWVRVGRADKVQAALNAGANPKWAKSEAFSTAVLLGREDMIEILMPISEPIHALGAVMLSTDRDREYLARILEQCADQHQDIVVRELRTAISFKAFDKAELLLQHVTSVPLMVEHNILYQAAGQGHLRLCQLLLDRHLGRDAIGTAIIHAAREGQYDAMLMLMDQMPEDGRVPHGQMLSQAIKANNANSQKMIDFLLPFCDDTSKSMACIDAARDQKWELVEKLWNTVDDVPMWMRSDIVLAAVFQGQLKKADYYRNGMAFGKTTFMPDAGLFARYGAHDKPSSDHILNFVLQRLDDQAPRAGLLHSAISTRGHAKRIAMILGVLPQGYQFTEQEVAYVVNKTLEAVIEDIPTLTGLLQALDPFHVQKIIESGPLKAPLYKTFSDTLDALVVRKQLRQSTQHIDNLPARARKM